MLDMKLLIIGSSFTLIILAITSSFFMFKYPKIRYMKCFFIFSILFFIGLLLTSSRNIISDFFSIIMGNMLLITAYMILYIGIQDLLNLDGKWRSRYFIPIMVTFFGFILFTYVHYDVAMRIIIFSIFCLLYCSVISWMFLKNARKELIIIDYLSSFFFFIGIIMFTFRMFWASLIEIPANYLATTDFMIILAYMYLIFITIWLLIILINSKMHISSSEKNKIEKK